MTSKAQALAAVLTLALWLVGGSVRGQISNPIRVGGNRQPVNATRPIGRLDCESRTKVSFQVSYPGDGTTFNALQFWIGAQASSCMDMATRHPATNAVCWPIGAASINGQQSMYFNNDLQIEARFLVDPLGGNCANPTTPSRGTINTNFLSLLVVSGAGTVMTGMSIGIPFDLDPPATPTDVTVRPGEGSIEVSWRYRSSTVSTSDASTSADDAAATTTTSTTDLAGFWVLCDPPGVLEAGDAGAGDAGRTTDADLEVPDNVLGSDAGASCSGSFPTIDPYDAAQFNRYARGGRTSANATSLSVTGLRNGVSYRCVVVAEDIAGNRTMSSPSSCATPVPVTDFWERYRSSGGRATVACATPPRARGGSRLVPATLPLAAVGFALRRRRRS